MNEQNSGEIVMGEWIFRTHRTGRAADTPLVRELLSLGDAEFAGAQQVLFGNCREVQETVLLEILNHCKNTEFGKRNSFENIHCVEDYRAMMPLTEFTDYETYTERLAAGEADLLFPGSAVSFYLTSGSTSTAKLIPENPCGRDARRLISRARNIYMLRQAKGETGRVILMTNAAVANVTSAGIPCGSASGQTMELQSPETEALLAYPVSINNMFTGDDLNYMLLRCTLPFDDIIGILGNNAARLSAIVEYAGRNGRRLIADIREGGCSLPLPEEAHGELEKYLVAKPERADFLEGLYDEGRFLPKFYWPRLKLAGFWLGGSVGVYVDEVRPLLPEATVYMDVGYGSSEMKFNIPTTPGLPSGALATYCGFFEFIPENGGAPLLAHELTDGERYELVVTTYAGLYRYRMHDLVQVDGYTQNTPNIFFVTKLGDIGSIAQEKLPGSVLADFANKTAKAFGYVIAAVQAHTDRKNKRYSVYLELSDSEGADTQKLADALDKVMYESISAYKSARNGALRPLTVSIMKRGWKEYLYEKHRKGAATIAQIKLPVIISEPPEDEWIYYKSSANE